MSKSIETIKSELIEALSHREAEDGLFFCNFTLLHEEDERPYVNGSPKAVAAALNELVREGIVYLWEESDRIVFKLKRDVVNLHSLESRDIGQQREKDKLMTVNS
ncbi:MAG: hypothetical protein KDD70_03140 [Bdellovibrionales bacterium]|nr:hypothetical protein [Bdellovibrionales bacterium]